jgi:hypothetical protein
LRPNIVGCENEGGVGFENLKNGHAVYMLDNCARVSLNPNGGIFLNGPDTDGGLIGRRQSTAFNWLCYVPAGRVVQWEEEEWGSPYVNLFPEEGIYMTRPLQSMLAPGACPDSTISAGGAGNDGTSGLPCRIHGHNDLMVLGSSPLPVERREFAQCYNRARLIGVCGVIWNMTPFPVTVGSGWLRQKYAHTMTMHRGTIDEGGTVTFDARVTPAGTIIPAYDALFLFQ